MSELIDRLISPDTLSHPHRAFGMFLEAYAPTGVVSLAFALQISLIRPPGI